jgi:hypothetical protein
MTSVLSLPAPVVFKLFVGLVEENINYKDVACFYENRKLHQNYLTISVICRFSPHDHLSLDTGKRA